MQGKEDTVEAINEIQEHVNIIYDAIEEIKSILMHVAPDELRRAESYWLAHIDGALENRGGYLGGSFTSYKDTLEALERMAE